MKYLLFAKNLLNLLIVVAFIQVEKRII